MRRPSCTGFLCLYLGFGARRECCEQVVVDCTQRRAPCYEDNLFEEAARNDVEYHSGTFIFHMRCVLGQVRDSWVGTQILSVRACVSVQGV